jgi:PEP-CTERM motif
MRQTRVLWLCLLFCLFCTFAYADSIPIDPDIQVNDPSCDSGCTNVTAATPFTFSSNASGGGTTNFRLNGSGFFTLDIETVGTFAVNCFSNAFGSCTSKVIGGVTDIYLSGCSDSPCLRGDGSIFDIDLDNVILSEGGGCALSTDGTCQTPTPGTGSWSAIQSFTAIGGNFADATTPFISAPEPSSFFLLCTGAAAGALRRRMIKA